MVSLLWVTTWFLALRFSIICGVDRPNIYNHLQRFHKLQIARYRELETDAVRLEQYKKRHGFTDIVGQCGYCLAHFDSAKNTMLLKHLKSCIKNPAVNPSERKGVSKSSKLIEVYCLI